MSFKLTLIQALVFYTLSYDLDCKICGGCSLSTDITYCPDTNSNICLII